MSRTLEERIKEVDNYFDSMTDEEGEKFFSEAHTDYIKSWLPENQNSFYKCIYCREDGHITLCNDLIGRSFCPACKDRAEKEFLGYKIEED